MIKHIKLDDNDKKLSEDERCENLCLFWSDLDDNDEKLCEDKGCENLQGKNSNQPGSLQQTLNIVTDMGAIWCYMIMHDSIEQKQFKKPLSKQCLADVILWTHLSSLGDERLAGEGHGKEEESLRKTALQ